VKFAFVPPAQPREVFGNAWIIYGDGEIDFDAGKRLQELVKQNNIPNSSMLYLNSPGGSLSGGMALGRAIRSAGLFTYIGRAASEKTIGNWTYRETAPGECYSAATLAFLGGQFRWIDEKSVYGVHRFYADKDPGSDAAQVASSAIVEYVREMGVDPAYFSEMTKVGASDVNVLTPDRLHQLGIVNGPSNRTAWTIESFGEGLYFKGERLTWRGINKFILIAAPKGTVLHVIYNPEGRGDEAIQMKAHSLFVDDQAYPLELDFKPHLLNGLVNCMYSLNSDLIAKIKAAKEVGIAMQWAYGAPIFLGFNGMQVEEGRSKLRGYLALHDR